MKLAGMKERAKMTDTDTRVHLIAEDLNRIIRSTSSKCFFYGSAFYIRNQQLGMRVNLDVN